MCATEMAPKKYISESENGREQEPRQKMKGKSRKKKLKGWDRGKKEGGITRDVKLRKNMKKMAWRGEQRLEKKAT